jgi:hypothetical protein
MFNNQPEFYNNFEEKEGILKINDETKFIIE